MIKSLKLVVVAVLALGSLNAWAGQTIGGNKNATRQSDSHDHCGCGSTSKGMPTYSFASMLASLSIRDTPINYTPPVGPSLDTTIYYNQRDINQPLTFDAFNISHRWTMNWLSYIRDYPATPGANVSRYVAGGGEDTYTGYNASSGAYKPQLSGAVLVMVSANPVVYDLLLPNGGEDVFSAPDVHSYNGVEWRQVYLTKIVDPHGNAVTLNYDSQMRLTSVTDAIGQSLTFQYADGHDPLLVTSITDPFGRHATLGYDDEGRLAAITDEIGMTSTFTYQTPPSIGSGGGVITTNSSGVPVSPDPVVDTNIQSMTTPYGTTQFAETEGANGDPTELSIQATDPLGYTNRTEYHIAAPGVPFSEPNAPAGMSVFNAYLNYRDSYYWDKDEYAAACTGSGASVTCDYSKARMKHFLHEYPCCEYTSAYLESVKFPLESMIWYDYAGQPSAYFPGPSSKPNHIGRVLDNGATQLTAYTYNAWGNITAKTDPDGRETVYTYASNGVDVVEVQQRNGTGLDTLARYTYNSQHEPLTYADAAGKTTAYTYNALGQKTSVTDPLGNKTTYTYNANGYLVRIINADGHVQHRFTYDTYGRVASDTDSRGYTRRYAYDALNRITRVTYPDGTADQFTWNRLDLASKTDREGHTTRYTYDADRSLITIVDPMGLTTHLTYYPSGKLHTMTSPNGNVTTWTRDIEGRVIAKTYADGKGNTYTYDNSSRLASKTDALGQTTAYTYDPDDLVTGIAYSHAVNPTANVLYNYGSSYPRMLSMTDGLGTTILQYVPAGTAGALKLQSVAGPFGVNDTVSYTYDADGRVIDRTTDQSDRFTYDALGRVNTETNPLGIFTRRYLGDTRQPTSQQLTASTGHQGYGLDLIYDGNIQDRQLRSLTYRGPMSILPTEQMTFTHSPTHQLTSQLDFTGAGLFGSPLQMRLFGYHYDHDNRLKSVTFDALFPAGRYSYDADGSLLQYQDGSNFNAAANGLDQLSIVNGKAWQYDADGNLINDGRHAYSWDAANRLTQVTNLKTGEVTHFAYDGMGRRLVISEQDKGGNATETHYVWCGDTLCGARAATGQVLADYFTQGEQGDHYTGAGQRDVANKYYVKNQIGSIVGVMNARGNLQGSTEYTAYGAARHSMGAKASFGYAGMFYNPATGLYLTKYREYMPGAGRWLNRDPIGIAGGQNIYAYVNGNPENLTDPYGLKWIYQQSTGNIYYQPPASQGGGPRQLVSSGGHSQYSGQNAGLDNPANQSVPGTSRTSNGGPIPQGTYDIGLGHHSRTTGPDTMNLTPQSGTNTFGRTLFRIHGDNSYHNQSASEGCIIAGPRVRNEINNSHDRVLQVIQ